MAVAIIGTGNIGSRVARRLAEGGEDVVVAASNPESAQEAAQQIGRGVRAADVKDAIANADVVVFATWFDATKQLVADNTDALSGKIVVDPSNNIAPDGDGFKSLNPEGVSAGQQIAPLLPPDTRYVKAFGTLGAESLDATQTETGEKVALYYATDDDAAGGAVAELITRGGWDAVRAGGVDDTAPHRGLRRHSPIRRAERPPAEQERGRGRGRQPVTRDGRERHGHAVLVEDSDKAAEDFAALLNRVGPRPLGRQAPRRPRAHPRGGQGSTTRSRRRPPAAHRLTRRCRPVRPDGRDCRRRAAAHSRGARPLDRSQRTIRQRSCRRAGPTSNGAVAPRRRQRPRCVPAATDDLEHSRCRRGRPGRRPPPASSWAKIRPTDVGYEAAGVP